MVRIAGVGKGKVCNIETWHCSMVAAGMVARFVKPAVQVSVRFSDVCETEGPRAPSRKPLC